MFEQTFRNIDNVLSKEAGCTTELDYTEQTSCISTTAEVARARSATFHVIDRIPLPS
jgi:hypothetical protein